MFPILNIFLEKLDEINEFDLMNISMLNWKEIYLLKYIATRKLFF